MTIRETTALLRETVPHTAPPAEPRAPFGHTTPSGHTPEPRASARAKSRPSLQPQAAQRHRVLSALATIAALAIVAAWSPAAHAAEHTLEFVSIDCGAAQLSGGGLTMSVTIGQPDAITLTSQRLELIGGIQSAALAEAACNGDERLRSNCRAKECGHRFKAVLRGATPGQTVTFLLDGGDEREAVVNGRGKATVSWCPAANGKHTASVAECGVADKAKCR